MKSRLPPVGACAWHLKGKSLTERMEWVIKNKFTGVSFLQSVMNTDREDRKDAAAAIKAAKLNVTYHGNVQHKLTNEGELDLEFIKQLLDDVIWWNENTAGVSSCCYDSIKPPKDGEGTFNTRINKEYMTLLRFGLKKYGIRIGIENIFAGHAKLYTIEDFNMFKKECSGLDIGLLFDAAHANIHVRSGSEKKEREIGDYYKKMPLETLEIHFSDNLGKKDEHKELGYGNLDLKALLLAVKEKGFKGQFTIEVCKDLLSGIYSFDITNPGEADPILRSRDKLISTWNSANLNY
ncbi:MAG: hypothetical protein A2231_02765 [Candidatus Firestonebacteria bacterium RIFOXYA2_FULL_40_8]|nr:MAG: hypothetical protein A2231_02765 [Candidatus Firestonebacteria bacterium RIFOXYA2_FULL_40_8]